MSIKLTRRIASQMLGRGVSKVRIKPAKLDDATKAITREDVRNMIAAGSIYAVPEKHNLSLYSKALQIKRSKGRSRGHGRRKGSLKARQGLVYGKKVRGQRRVLASLKMEKVINNEEYKKYYRLVKGGNFQSKAQLLSHITAAGTKIEAEKLEKLRHM